MSKSLNHKSNILNLFLAWRVYLLFVAILAIYFLPRFSDNFLAGRLVNYVKNPLFWGWANFDGEHYLSISIYGYKNLQQAFFPFYPYLIKLFSLIFGSSLVRNVIYGLIISNLSFFLALVIFYKVILLDFSEKIAKYSIFSLLLFPTSFYFGAVYTEGLFLLLSLATYFLYRKEKYLLSGLMGILMTLTRVYGVFVILMILIDLVRKKKKLKEIINKKIYWLFISLFGVVGYMLYLLRQYSDPFAFYNLQTIVGEQHQKGIVLLPQVFFRYLKILISSGFTWFSLNTTILEITTGVLFTLIPAYILYNKVRPSKVRSDFNRFGWGYISYILLGFLVPSAQGSFSSVPRYVLVIFPAFIAIGLFLSKHKKVRLFYFLLFGFWLMINTALFIRGYFVA